MWKKPHIASETSGRTTSMSQSGPVSHEGTRAGTKAETVVSTATPAAASALRPSSTRPAISSTARNTHITSASSWAIIASPAVRSAIAIAMHQ